MRMYYASICKKLFGHISCLNRAISPCGQLETNKKQLSSYNHLKCSTIRKIVAI